MPNIRAVKDRPWTPQWNISVIGTVKKNLFGSYKVQRIKKNKIKQIMICAVSSDSYGNSKVQENNDQESGTLLKN